MRGFAVLVAILGVVGFAQMEPHGPPAQATSLACPANSSPPNPADPSMILNAPAAGATVTSPVHLEGRARVFEANVRITVYSASGMVLTDTFTTAAEAGPALAPFSADVPFTVLMAQAGCIRVFEASAQDGSPRNVVQVEVNLSPGTIPSATPTPAPVTPPSTGDGGVGDERTRFALPLAIAAVLLAAALCVRLRRGGASA